VDIINYSKKSKDLGEFIYSTVAGEDGSLNHFISIQRYHKTAKHYERSYRTSMEELQKNATAFEIFNAE